jgi:hypothetical protein
MKRVMGRVTFGNRDAEGGIAALRAAGFGVDIMGDELYDDPDEPAVFVEAWRDVADEVDSKVVSYEIFDDDRRSASREL